jgi:hypothetical protein
MGKWIRSVMLHNYLTFFKPEGLCAIGEWPHAAQKDFGHFWHERFLISVSPSLVNVVYPFLASLKEQYEELLEQDEKVPSVASMISVLEYLGTVLIQDAVHLLWKEKYKKHPLHKHLLKNVEFR